MMQGSIPDNYFGLHRRQPPAAVSKQMRDHLDMLFHNNTYDSVLYIGANKRRQYFLDWFEKAGYSRMVVMEAFKENVDYLKAHMDGWPPALDILHADIRDSKSIPGTFDVSFF